MCVCGCADVCLCRVPRRVDTAVGLCVGMYAYVGAPRCPGSVGVLVLSGCTVWVSCLECAAQDVCSPAGQGSQWVSVRTGSHSLSPYPCSHSLPLGRPEGTQAGRVSVFMF